MVYHDGPLKGRCEPLKLLLEDALESWGFGIGPGGQDVGASFFKHLAWGVELRDSWHGLGFERIWWLAFPVLSRFWGLGLRGLGLRVNFRGLVFRCLGFVKLRFVCDAAFHSCCLLRRLSSWDGTGIRCHALTSFYASRYERLAVPYLIS